MSRHIFLMLTFLTEAAYLSRPRQTPPYAHDAAYLSHPRQTPHYAHEADYAHEARYAHEAAYLHEATNKLDQGNVTDENVTKNWRDDGRCGQFGARRTKEEKEKGIEIQFKPINGKAPECDPTANAIGKGPCCSAAGWCGNTDDHCKCSLCIDYSDKVWRDDGHCGANFPLPNGEPAECDPEGNGVGKGPCCSHFGVCGNSERFCNCPSCINYSGSKCITSPDYPRFYPSNNWTTEEFSVTPGFSIDVTIHDIDLYFKSYLWFLDGNMKPIVEKLYGNLYPKHFNIPTSTASYVFKYENNIGAKGFKFCYKPGKKIDKNWKLPNVNPPQCGEEQKPEKPTGCGNSRISGGCPAYPHQYPWMVRWGDKPGCGGSLITSRHVITAAHCVEKSWYHVKVKVHNQTDPFSYEAIPVVDAVKNWNEERVEDPDDDSMAILTLAWPVDLHEKNIGTVCLPPSVDEDYRGETATAMGWGMTYFGSGQSPLLKHLKLTVLQKNHPYYIYTEVPVLGGVSQDPCAGDSGGPLVHKDVKTGRWTIIGTVWGQGYNCKTNNTLPDGGAWNKVTGHLDWIKSIIAE